MTPEKSAVVKALESLGWRALMMAASVVLAGLLDAFAGLNLNPMVVTVAGLVFGELSKMVANQLKD